MFNKKRKELEARVQELESENRNYTDVITNALVDAAADTVASSYLSALEIAAGALSRAFAAATIQGRDSMMFDSWTMAQMGREIVEEGETIWFRIGNRLTRGNNYEISPDETEYTFNLPSGAVRAPANRVLHARWNIDVNSKRGIGPLQNAQNLRRMVQRLEGSISDEMSAAVGYLLPIPADGNAHTVEQLKKDLAVLKGNIALVETARAGWGQGSQTGTRREFELVRMGPNLPDSSVMLYKAASDNVLSTCGYPPTLVGNEDGTAQREAWRRYLHGTVAPIGFLMQEAARQGGMTIIIGFDNLFASDIMGRARAFQSMVGGGMDVAKAAALSGLMSME